MGIEPGDLIQLVGVVGSAIGVSWWLSAKITTIETVLLYYVVPELKALKGESEEDPPKSAKEIARQVAVKG